MADDTVGVAYSAGNDAAIAKTPLLASNPYDSTSREWLAFLSGYRDAMMWQARSGNLPLTPVITE